MTLPNFPKGYFNIGGRDFEWVYRNRKEYVDFTVNEMQKPTGLFRKWQEYCKKQIKLKHGHTGRPKNGATPP